VSSPQQNSANYRRIPVFAARKRMESVFAVRKASHLFTVSSPRTRNDSVRLSMLIGCVTQTDYSKTSENRRRSEIFVGRHSFRAHPRQAKVNINNKLSRKRC
jgi:hypothetical protein